MIKVSIIIALSEIEARDGAPAAGDSMAAAESNRQDLDRRLAGQIGRGKR
jgi:hypothetical protein